MEADSPLWVTISGRRNSWRPTNNNWGKVCSLRGIR